MENKNLAFNKKQTARILAAKPSSVGDSRWRKRVVRGQLGQVFLNLISNAVAACEPADAETHEIGVRTADVDSGISVEISDTGSGIRPERAPHVFTPFWTTRASAGGSGLGLFVSRRIAEQHGGSIEFRPGHKRGTVFTLRLPECPPDSPNNRPPPRGGVR